MKYTLLLLSLHSRLQTPTGRARCQKPEGPSKEDSPVRKRKLTHFVNINSLYCEGRHIVLGECLKYKQSSKPNTPLIMTY